MREPDISIEGPVDPDLAGRVCEDVLRALPDWFGIETATAQYIQAARALPTWLALRSGQPVGFITIKQHFPGAAEIYVMGVLPEHHGCGIGKRLLAAVETALRGQGTLLLQVKTLAACHPDENYARTRAFYRAVGFQPLEEITDLWGPANPCLMLVKPL